MKDLDLWVFISVFQEMLGPMLWVLIALGVAVLVATVRVLIRDRGVSSRRFLRAEIVGVVGGIGAVLFMQAITHSRFADAGGPIDVILIAAIWLAGAIGTTLIAYLAQSLNRAR